MTYERELKKYQESIGVKVQYKIVVHFYHHPENRELSYPLVLETTCNKSEAKKLQKIYNKCIHKKNNKFFYNGVTKGAENIFDNPEFEVASANVNIEEEYVCD